MRPPRSLRRLTLAGCAAVVCSLPPGALTRALAQNAATLEVEVATGAGHDSNALFQLIPSGSTTAAAAGWYGAVLPAVTGSLVWGKTHQHRLSLGYLADWKASNTFDFLLFHSGNLAYLSPPWHGARIAAAASGGQFTTGQFQAADFRFLAGELGLRAELSPRWRLALTYIPEWRVGSEPAAQAEILHFGQGALRFAVSTNFAAGLFASHLSLGQGALLSAPYRQQRGGLFAGWEHGRWSASARAYGGLRALQTGTAPTVTQLQPTLGVGLGLRFAVTPSLALVALGEAAADVGGRGLAGNADRRQASLMMVLSGAARRAGQAPAHDAELAPRIEGPRIRLRCRAPHARSVHAIGSFDGWGDGQALAPVADAPGFWEVWMPVEPGEIQYRFVVDGIPTRPEKAPRYVPDGFGGQDAVAEIPR